MHTKNTDAITTPAILQCFLLDEFPAGKLVFLDMDGNAFFTLGNATDFEGGMLESTDNLFPAELLDDAQQGELTRLLTMQKKYENTPLRIVQITIDAVVISHKEQPRLFISVNADTLGTLTAAHIAALGAGAHTQGDLARPFTGYLSETQDFVIY